MATLKVASLDTAFAQDPAITLKEYIEDNYTILAPPKASVNFDTKFARLDKYNHVVVEELPSIVTPQTLGLQRYRYEIVKRIQIWCGRSSGKNNAFLIAEHIEDIINANPLGMLSDGIEFAFIHDWNPVPTQPAPSDEEALEAKSTKYYRLSAQISMFYDKYSS